MSVPPGAMPPQGPPGPPGALAPPMAPPGPLPPHMMPQPLPKGPSGKGDKNQKALAKDSGIPPPTTAYDPNPWPDRIAQWNDFSRKFFESGSRIESRYEDDRDSMMLNDPTVNGGGYKRVNLFYSNVTILKESLYNSLPKPDVSRLHKGDYDNEPARVAAMIMERGLTYEVQQAPSFDAAIKAAILDRLVPGLGTLWVTFVPADGKTPEYMTIDIVYWRDLLFEPRRAWEQINWVGRKLYMDQDVAEKRWGKVVALPVVKTANIFQTSPDYVDKNKTCVIQMWDKANGKIVHLDSAGAILDENDDPYSLKDFFPTPKPLIANPPTRKFQPLSDYYMAQDQYTECDTLYARINLIIEAIKVAGVYDASVTEIGRMLGGTENRLIPVDNWAMFADKGGVKGVIDWYPVETCASVLQQLVSTFTFLKQELFEVTGMADIIRGASNQYETAAAQQIKAQFASVRLTAFQRDVAFFVRDTMRIMGDLMSQLYSNQKWAKICGNLPDPDMLVLGPALAILRDQFLASYSIDIESDSLTQADWALQQQQRLAYVQALAQFLQQALPVAQQIPSLAPMLLTMIKFASVGFRGSTELEGVIDASLTTLTQQAAAGAGQGPPPSPQQQAAQAQQAATQQQLQTQAQEHAQQMQFAQEKHDQAMQQNAEKHNQDLQYEEAKSSQKLIQSGASHVQGMQQDAIGHSVEMGRAIQRADTDVQIAKEKAAAQQGLGEGG